MARVFNLVVFDETISGSSSPPPPAFYTSQEHSALLGSVERLQIQLIVRGASSLAAPFNVDADYEITNAPEFEVWRDAGVKVQANPTAISDIPVVAFNQVSTIDEQAAYGRFKISCDADVLVQVQLVVAGYAD